MNAEVPTFGLRRGPALCISGAGYRAAVFHLGALTRLNEVGLLAGIETIYGAAGASILGALLAARIPWPLQGAFRDWPEEIAAPMREICGRRLAGARLFGSRAAGAVALQERYARELAAPERRVARGVRFVCGAAGLTLGQAAIAASGERCLHWELEGMPARQEGGRSGGGAVIAPVRHDLAPLDETQQALLENHGYELADTALRETGERVAAIEPLPPEPPHVLWASDDSLREMLEGPRRRWRPRRRVQRNRSGRHPQRSEVSRLLQRYRPLVQLDSLESYRPDPVETVVELAIGTRCNTLHRANGELIASTLPFDGVSRLHLDYLGAGIYADGQPVRDDDYLDEAGGSHAADALAMRQHHARAETVYGVGRWAEEQLWLQYWFFYYYNDKGFLKVGRHEGDWEMIQLRIGADGRPDAATYGRHSGGERARWEDVERQLAGEAEAPVVYCARGSHASLLRAGTQAGPAAPDHNDGLGPRVRPQLVELGAELPGWACWPGVWGSTKRREAFEGDSPRGPAHQPHWRDPARFHSEAMPAEQRPGLDAPLPPTPSFEARRDGDHIVLSYRFGQRREGEAEPSRIVAAAFGADGVAAATECFLVDGMHGACALPSPARMPARTVRACVASELGVPGATVTVPVG